jgi:hypothetical protein
VAELPRIGTPMYLVHTEETNYRTRLESIDGGTLSVAAPLETVGAVLRPGQEVEVFWAQPRARVVLPCRLIAIADAAPYRWMLEPVGDPQQSNRREYVRGGGGSTVRLATDVDEPLLDGRLLDISEGGLRCWVPQAPATRVGDRMRASLRLDTGELEQEGTVHTVRDAVEEPGRHLILRFTSDEKTARLIRQHVFAWELAERRRDADAS